MRSEPRISVDRLSEGAERASSATPATIEQIPLSRTCLWRQSLRKAHCTTQQFSSLVLPIVGQEWGTVPICVT